MNMDKYLKRHSDGQVDWSKEGFEMLNEFQQMVNDGLDLTCRKLLGGVLQSRGFEMVIPYEKYELSDSDRAVIVLMDDEALRVCRDSLVYNFPMHYESGSDELCDLWEMIRKAWNAESRY